MKKAISHIVLKPGERLDDTGFGGLGLIQNPEAFCYGTDAVLLADMAATAGTQTGGFETVADLGTGNGIIPLILSYRTESKIIYGIELQEDMASLAERNVNINNLEDRIHIINMDVKDIEKSLRDKAGTFDAVTTNPPYTAASCGMTGALSVKAIARHETTASLDAFVAAASVLLRDKGHFFMVHRPSRLVDICCSCRNNGIEPKELRFVSGRPGDKPNILLIHGVKNGGRELRMLTPLAVHNSDGGYSEEILKIYGRI